MAIAAPHDLLARLEALLNQVHLVEAELQALRDEVAVRNRTGGPHDNAGNDHAVSEIGQTADDLSDANLIDTHAAQERFGYPRDTIAKWCRQGDGVKVGGRWMASVPRLKARINGG
jgi:hypothetical protein